MGERKWNSFSLSEVKMQEARNECNKYDRAVPELAMYSSQHRMKMYNDFGLLQRLSGFGLKGV